MHLPALSAATFTHTTIDWIILVVFLLIVTFDAMRSGSGRAAVISTAFPLAVLSSELLPHTALLGSFVTSFSTPVLQAGLFVLIFGILFVLLHRIIFTFGGFSRGFLFSLLAGVCATAVFAAMWIQEPALQNIWHFGPQISSIFGGTYTLLWILGSYIVLAFVRS